MAAQGSTAVDPSLDSPARTKTSSISFPDILVLESPGQQGSAGVSAGATSEDGTGSRMGRPMARNSSASMYQHDAGGARYKAANLRSQLSHETHEVSQHQRNHFPSRDRVTDLDGLSAVDSSRDSRATPYSSDHLQREPKWKDSQVWNKETQGMEAEIAELQNSNMAAFGEQAEAMFQELNDLRGKQLKLYEEHIKLEKEFAGNEDGEEAMNITLEQMTENSKGAFENYAGADGLEQLLGQMEGLCDHIQDFNQDKLGTA